MSGWSLRCVTRLPPTDHQPDLVPKFLQRYAIVMARNTRVSVSAQRSGVIERSALAIVLIGALCVSACSRRATPPPRPASVPADAVWSGGPDGGAFISCLAVGREPTNLFECVVFGDQDGAVAARGRFATRPTFHVGLGELRRSYAGFDGTAILLANGAALAPDTNVPFAGPDAPR